MPSQTSAEDRKQSSIDDTKAPAEGKKLAVVLSIASLLFTIGFYYIVTLGVVRVYPRGMTAEKLKGFALRIEYTLRYQTLQVFWLLFNVLATMAGRNRTNAINPLDHRTEPRMQGLKNVLTNSFESAIISIFAQLIFVSFAEAQHILVYIPFVNIIQFMARVAYFVGYPMKRSFGFVITFLTNSLMMGYNIYKFGSFVGLY